MKPLRSAIILLLSLYAVFAGSLLYAAGQLPERVATHFDFRGKPDGWMSKEADLLFMAAVGFGLPLFIVGLSFATRFFPRRLVNLPHRDYWLAPERRKATSAYVGNHSLWLASMMLAFLTAVHLLMVFANAQPSARLDTPTILALLAFFIAGTGLWGWRLYRHFDRPLEGAA
jgi:uncharacterized membrane protein